MTNKCFKKGMVLGILFLFLGVVTVSGLNVDIKNSSALGKFYGNTYTVDDEGDGDFTTITDAINYASDGDIIEVYSGKYFDNNIIVDKSVEIIGIDSELGSGDDKGNPIIDLSGKKIGFILLADGISISKFNITNVLFDPVPGKSGAIFIESNSNQIIDNKFITNSPGGKQGIYIYINLSSNNIIRNNHFYNAFFAIIVFFGKNNNISYNYFLEGNAIQLAGADNNFIYANEFSLLKIGILFEVSCDKNIVSYNNFNFSGLVLYIMWSNYNIIEYNNFIKRGKTVSFASSHLNRWHGNYWEDLPKGRPKIIWGINLYCVPWVNIDWRPSVEPNIL